eukprot:6177926-Pleurochrysis_carterae.AAC.2
MNHATDNEVGGAGSPFNAFKPSAQAPRAVLTSVMCTLADSEFVKSPATLSAGSILRTSTSPFATYSRTSKSWRSTWRDR